MTYISRIMTFVAVDIQSCCETSPAKIYHSDFITLGLAARSLIDPWITSPNLNQQLCRNFQIMAKKKHER